MGNSRLAASLVMAAGCASACNAIVGNDDVSLWNPDAGAPSLDAAAEDEPSAADAATGPPTGIAQQVFSNYAQKCIDVGTESDASLTLTPCLDLPEQLIVFESAGLENFTLLNPKSGGCIGADARDAGSDAATALTLQTCNGGPAQVFHLKGSTGAYVFVTTGNNLCFDDLGFDTANGAPVGLFGCNAGLNQGWSIEP